MEHRPAGAVLAVGMGRARHDGRARRGQEGQQAADRFQGRGAGRRRQDAGRQMVSRHAHEFRAEHAEKARLLRSHAVLGRRQGQAQSHLGRTEQPGVALRPGPEGRRRAPGRPRRRLHAQHARDGDRDDRYRLDRCGVDLLLARLRRARRARPLRPGRAQGAAGAGRLLHERQGGRPARQGLRHRQQAALGARSGDRALPVGFAERRRRAACAHLAGIHRALQGRPGGIQPAALRPSALHPVFLRHHRGSEVHRAQRRRHPAQAPGRTPAALRRAPRRPPVLLHQHRLDDVELAGLGPGIRRDPDPLRRFAFHPPRQHPVGPGAKRER